MRRLPVVCQFNVDHYDAVSTPEADYLVLYLGTALTPAVFAWANEVIQGHPDHNVIIAVHHYLTQYGGFDYEYQGKQVYDELVVPNANVGMVIAGHHCSPVTRVQHPTEGRNVYEVMMDPQCNPNGGDGWMRYIDFDVEASTMEQSTFSIKKEGTQYWPEGQPNSGGSIDLKENENFIVDYDLQRAARLIETDSLAIAALDTFAVRRGSVYHVKNSLAGGEADLVVNYGRTADQVIVGDWDGDGSDTFAVRRGKKYFVKNTIAGGDADTVLSYGRAADVTLAGDWDGDGIDTFAVRRGSQYHAKNSLRGGAADTVVNFGRELDEVIVGDWNGDGFDTLGIRRSDGAGAATVDPVRVLPWEVAAG